MHGLMDYKSNPPNTFDFRATIFTVFGPTLKFHPKSPQELLTACGYSLEPSLKLCID